MHLVVEPSFTVDPKYSDLRLATGAQTIAAHPQPPTMPDIGRPYLVNQDFGGKVLEVFERLDASNFLFTRNSKFL
jgi:hypothetical protein